MKEKEYMRLESDSIGTMEVPEDAYYGVQALRAKENFPITGTKLHPVFIKNLAKIKRAAAITNRKAGRLKPEIANAIEASANEVICGMFDKDFIVDGIQGGAGTSANMNMNEVIANRAIEMLCGKKGDYTIVHPNDHVNMAQSANDVIPTAGKLTVLDHLKPLDKSLSLLTEALYDKAEEFDPIVKIGRTQLEDAVPMTLGQTFYGFASILRNEIKHLNEAAADFLVVNMGSTAIGTGICSEPGYAEKTIEALKEITGWEVSLADDWVGATSDTSSKVGYMSALKRVAVKINKICNDLRLLASGPRCGFGEINLPARQPGSSIMPGKVNPVIPEVMSQIAFKVMGNELCVTMAGEASQMELNAMEPIMAQCCFESIDLLINGFDTLRTLCIDGITANEEACRNEVKRSIGVVTALNPYIGYDHSTYIAKKAMETGRSVYDLVLEEGILTQEDLDTILDPKNMIKPVKLDIKARK